MQGATRFWTTAFVLVTASAASAGAQVTRFKACPLTRAWNTWRTVDGWVGTTHINKDFFFGTGSFDATAYSSGASSGPYYFGNLTDATGRWAYAGATIGVTCKTVGTYSPPMSDTTWSDLFLENSQTGTLQAVYQAEESGCYQDLGCDESGGGGSGGGGGSTTCYYIVAADEYGNPILDESGNWIVLQDLGCS